MKSTYQFLSCLLIALLLFAYIPAQAFAQNMSTQKITQEYSLDQMFIKKDNSLWRWGYYVGDGTDKLRSTPVKVLDDVETALDTMAIKNDGTLWSWGDNTGDGTRTARLSPVKIADDVAVICQTEYFNTLKMFIKKDGTLWAWGMSSYGVGDGTKEYRYSPVKILDDVAFAVSGDANTRFAIKKDASLWAWGDNRTMPYTDSSCGKLGDGTVETRLSPVKIMDSVSSVSTVGDSTMAVKKDGTLWAWGEKVLRGRVYTGHDIDEREKVLSPVKIMDGIAEVNRVGGWAQVIKTDGTLWAWGNNLFSTLGDGTSINRDNPVKIMDDVASVSASDTGFSMAIKTDGTLWAWGINEIDMSPYAMDDADMNIYYGNDDAGWLGTGTKDTRSSPTKIMENVAVVRAENRQTIALKTDGTLWVWGANTNGDLGGGKQPNQMLPIKIADGVKLPGGVAEAAPTKPSIPATSSVADIASVKASGDYNVGTSVYGKALTKAELDEVAGAVALF